MKIKRFVAADMRQAMREVREEQGAEAAALVRRGDRQAADVGDVAVGLPPRRAPERQFVPSPPWLS